MPDNHPDSFVTAPVPRRKQIDHHWLAAQFDSPLCTDATHILKDLNLPDPSQAVGSAYAAAQELLHCTTQSFDALPIDFDKLASECSVVEIDCLAGVIPLGAKCASAIQRAAHAAAGPASTLIGVAKCAQVVTAVLAQGHAGRLFTEGAVMGCDVLQKVSGQV